LTNRECMHLVTRGHFRLHTWQRWRSHHSIRHSQKLHATCKLHVSMLYKRSYCWWKLYIAEWGFSTFVLLWPWPWLDDIHIRTWPLFPGDTPDVQIWTCYASRPSNVIVWQTDRQTDRRT